MHTPGNTWDTHTHSFIPGCSPVPAPKTFDFYPSTEVLPALRLCVCVNFLCCKIVSYRYFDNDQSFVGDIISCSSSDPLTSDQVLIFTLRLMFLYVRIHLNLCPQGQKMQRFTQRCDRNFGLNRSLPATYFWMLSPRSCHLSHLPVFLCVFVQLTTVSHPVPQLWRLKLRAVIILSGPKPPVVCVCVCVCNSTPLHSDTPVNFAFETCLSAP